MYEQTREILCEFSARRVDSRLDARYVPRYRRQFAERNSEYRAVRAEIKQLDLADKEDQQLLTMGDGAGGGAEDRPHEEMEVEGAAEAVAAAVTNRAARRQILANQEYTLLGPSYKQVERHYRFLLRNAEQLEKMQIKLSLLRRLDQVRESARLRERAGELAGFLFTLKEKRLREWSQKRGGGGDCDWEKEEEWQTELNWARAQMLRLRSRERPPRPFFYEGS